MDRLLNHNLVVTLKNDIVTIVTSNNSQIVGDTGRRSLAIRLVPECEYPEYREFQRTDLLRHVQRHRSELALAAITILRWQIVRGYPETKVFDRITDDGQVVQSPVGSFGSFEAWSRLVRQAVIQLGLPDPVRTQSAIREIDDQAIAKRRFVTALAEWKPDWNGTAEELVRDVCSLGKASEVWQALDGILDWEDFNGPDPIPARVGYKLRALRDQWFGSWAITKLGQCRNGVRWGLKSSVIAERPPAPPQR